MAFRVHWLCDSMISLGTQAPPISLFCQWQYKLCSKAGCSGDQNILVSCNWRYKSPCSGLVWKSDHLFLWFSLVAGRFPRRSQDKSLHFILTWFESCAHFWTNSHHEGSFMLRPSTCRMVGSPGSKLWDSLCAGGLLEGVLQWTFVGEWRK